MGEFQVERKALKTHRIVDGIGADTPVSGAELLLKVERFAFTANNVTYGVAGDQIGYWQFFPPFGGLYGYFPPAEFLKITAGKVTDGRVFDTSEHRAALPPVYNSLTRVAAEPGYDPAQDDLRCLLWPLFITSFCLWDSAQDNGWCLCFGRR